jgi:aminobenzoyl-glutamate utilization protein B
MPKKTAMSHVESHAQDLSNWCSTIFDFAEPAWREYKSAAWYVNQLRAEGFTVEQGSGGMPTAFAADWSNGDGPIIGMYAEYDAVPGNCQAASTQCEPRDGLTLQAAGHTDPHSGLGIGALGGLLATKAAMQTHNIKGGLRFMGEPAEKNTGVKTYSCRTGVL